jgi:hypothetical protein
MAPRGSIETHCIIRGWHRSVGPRHGKRRKVPDVQRTYFGGLHGRVVLCAVPLYNPVYKVGGPFPHNVVQVRGRCHSRGPDHNGTSCSICLSWIYSSLPKPSLLNLKKKKQKTNPKKKRLRSCSTTAGAQVHVILETGDADLVELALETQDYIWEQKYASHQSRSKL